MPPENSELARWFAEEVQPHESALRFYLQGKFSKLTDIDNLVQESLTRVWRMREKGPVSSPRGLLFAIARNLALDLMRRQQLVAYEAIPDKCDSFVYMDEADTAETVCKQQEFELLIQAIQSMPERCRQVFTLRVTYGLTQRQIAEKLGITESTVEKQMSKGIRLCCEFFTRHGLP